MSSRAVQLLGTRRPQAARVADLGSKAFPTFPLSPYGQPPSSSPTCHVGSPASFCYVHSTHTLLLTVCITQAAQMQHATWPARPLSAALPCPRSGAGTKKRGSLATMSTRVVSRVAALAYSRCYSKTAADMRHIQQCSFVSFISSPGVIPHQSCK